MHPRTLINSKWKTHDRITGVQRYARELTKALADAGLEFDQACPNPGPTWKSILWEQRTLSQYARAYQTLFCPANMAPFALHTDVRLVVTIHCLRFFFYPENYRRSFVNWYRFVIPRIITRADSVLTVSQTAADEIGRIYPQAIGKLEVISPGVSNVFNTQGARGDNQVPPESYWVFIGNAAPAKNLRVVLEAIQHAVQPHRTVLLGVNQHQLDAIGVAYPPRQVIPLGHINDTNRVAAILRGATGLLAPSLYESFDLPIIEAMACGCPVIASDIPVHREIGQDVPMYVASDQGDQWGKAMDQLVHNLAMAQFKRAQGLVRARDFCWSKAAMRVMSIINRANDPESMNS